MTLTSSERASVFVLAFSLRCQTPDTPVRLWH
jgi:hypothetical protein